MKIEIAFRHPLRRWQYKLATDLREAGHDVSLAGRDGRKLGLAVGLALRLQQHLLGPKPSMFDAVPGEQSRRASGTAPDLVIGLDGVEASGRRVLEPIFDGRRGEEGLLAALARGNPPSVEIRAKDDGETDSIVSACLAVEEPSILSRSLDRVLARVVTLLLQAVRRLENGERLPAPTTASAAVPSSSPLAHIARGVQRKVAARLAGTNRGPNHWRTGYRIGSPGIAGGKWSKPRFAILPDDGSRFYADPMPFEHDGRRTIFVENYPYATGKGVISVVEIDATGNASAPRMVLEQPCHLSYPYVIRHRGEIYMMPEMSGARRAQLFRADPFPDRWVPDRILLEDVVASDATPVLHDGRLWLFATLSDDGGSTWDQLCLFHAPDLFGPWTPHAGNPVLVDAGCARPAGPMWVEDGQLMRIAQDCRTGYGVGLAVCRVDRLDPEGFAQTVVSRVAPPDGYGADGVHTLARAGDLEVIDLRFSAARR